MNKSFQIQVSESSTELLQSMKREKNKVNREKLHMLYLVATRHCKSKTNLARLLGRNRNTITLWLRIYEKGLKDLLQPQPNKGGRKPPFDTTSTRK